MLNRRASQTAHKSLHFEALEDRCLLAAGMLNPTFGAGGKVITDIGGSYDEARSVAVQSDGRIVVAGYIDSYGGRDGGGDFALRDTTRTAHLTRRLAPTARSSPTLADMGTFASVWYCRVTARLSPRATAIPPSTAVPTRAASTSLWWAYNPNGTLDTTFGTGGKVITDFGGYVDVGRGGVLQSDGKIVVAGRTYNGSGYDFAPRAIQRRWRSGHLV